MRALIWIAALFATGCSSGFWDMDPPSRIDAPPGLGPALRIETVQVRSTYYDPPDAFSRAFGPELQARTNACLAGPRGARAVVFIHALDRGGDLGSASGRLTLSGSVDVMDGGRVVARFPVSVDQAMADGDLDARRRAAGAAFGKAICAELGG